MTKDYIFKPNTRYEINTPSGFKKFAGVRKLDKDEHYKIILSNGTTLKCSLTHKFIKDGKEIVADDIQIGDTIDGDNGISVEVVEKVKYHKRITLFDIVEVDGGNIFNVDGIVSHNCDFVSSGNTVIEAEYLMWFKDTFVKEPIEKTGFDGNYWKWEYPDYTKTYMVSADVARGDGSDFSAFHVFDIVNNVQVAEYRGKIETKDFGNLLVAVATEWNNALLVVENANVGWAALQQCIDRGYGNIYYQSQDYKYVDVERQYTNRFSAEERREVAGFTTSARSRPLIISKLDEYFRSKEMVIQSIRLIDELFTFIWNGSRAEAMRGYNDDLTMAFAIGLWVRDTALRLRQERMDLTKQSLNSFTMTGISMGTSYQNLRQGNPWEMKIGGNNEDIKWLLG